MLLIVSAKSMNSIYLNDEVMFLALHCTLLNKFFFLILFIDQVYSRLVKNVIFRCPYIELRATARQAVEVICTYHGKK